LKRVFIASAIVVFFGLIGVGLFGQSGLTHLRKLRAERSRLEEQTGQLKKENESLRSRISLLADNLKYLEKLAREKLGMVRPDEVIIKMPEQGSTAGAANPVPQNQKKKEERSR